MNDSRDDETFDEYQDEPRKRRRSKSAGGMSTTMKVILGLSIFGVVTMVVCCGLGVYFATQAVNITQNPAEIDKIREDIAAIEIPDDLPAAMGMRMNMGVFKMDIAGYGNEGSEFLMLMQMDVAGASEAEMEQQFRSQASQQRNQDVTISKSETKVLTVDGEEREFVFAEGTLNSNGNQIPVHQVTGMFKGRNGYGYLMFIVPDEEWNEEETIQLIESIHK